MMPTTGGLEMDDPTAAESARLKRELERKQVLAYRMATLVIYGFALVTFAVYLIAARVIWGALKSTLFGC